MIIKDEPAATYHARPAVSAGLLWDIVKPDGCLALARWNSPWLNPDYQPERDEIADNGTLAHLAVLEEKKLEERIVIVDATNYRTKAAQLARDAAYEAGKIPILFDRDPGSTAPSFQKLLAVRKALANSHAAPLLFAGNGDNEVSYTFQIDGIDCKCRADRIVPRGDHHVMLDLKTSLSASPNFFQKNMWIFGHHLRAAFYLHGWEAQSVAGARRAPPVTDYLFVVVQREPPHIVTIYRIDAHSIVWGERMYAKGLALFKRARATDTWPGWQGDEPYTIALPPWADYHLADREAAGEL